VNEKPSFRLSEESTKGARRKKKKKNGLKREMGANNLSVLGSFAVKMVWPKIHIKIKSKRILFP